MNLLHTHLESQGEQNPVMTHGTTTKCRRCVWQAFDETEPKYVAKFLNDLNAHGWQPHDCDRRWQPRFWPVKGKSGRRKGVLCERDEMITKVAHGKDLYHCSMFPRKMSGSDGISKFVEKCETGVLEETGRCPEETNQKLQSNCMDIGDVQVLRIMYPLALRVGSRAWNVEESACWWSGWVSCQHLQVMATNLLQKHWEWQEERNPVMRHGTVVRPTLHLASLDIKTAFDEAKPRHVAKILDGHNTHGWIIAALLREMSRLSGKATFECVESSFVFNRCLQQGNVEAPRLWQKWQPRYWPMRGKNGWNKEKVFSWISMKEEEIIKHAVSCGPTTSGSYPTPRNTWSKC